MGVRCYRIREEFSDLLDERLAEPQRERVLAHLSRCSQCAGDYQLFRKAHELVAGLRPIPVPEDFTQQVLAKVRQHGLEHGSTWIPAVSRRPGTAARTWTWGAGLAAAAAVAALVVGLWMLMMHPRTDSASVPIAGKAAPPPAAASSPQFAHAPGAPVPGSPAGVGPRRAAPARGPAYARKGPADSLYDQPLDEPFPLNRNGAQLVKDSRDSGYRVVPAKSRGY
ncbi:MAG TPA: zf-HC2 domain-containing protein [Candidatus Saccharimonadales bacterium]|nr:zf-HC2 domain-containing protein [Candidatus Saccharimonadales bacterium]